WRLTPAPLAGSGRPVAPPEHLPEGGCPASGSASVGAGSALATPGSLPPGRRCRRRSGRLLASPARALDLAVPASALYVYSASVRSTSRARRSSDDDGHVPPGGDPRPARGGRAQERAAAPVSGGRRGSPTPWASGLDRRHPFTLAARRGAGEAVRHGARA